MIMAKAYVLSTQTKLPARELIRWDHERRAALTDTMVDGDPRKTDRCPIPVLNRTHVELGRQSPFAFGANPSSENFRIKLRIPGLKLVNIHFLYLPPKKKLKFAQG
jgi:hypothetical protein